ncbi:toll/interleukin-1 receptor domain-containing protein [Staphylococcus gallinarum]|uniref:toll/interleukin-1 receptor domain-containing protein n=1 Tax=Staphylococcus gallinarum TaxID=1293 RepID=UPI002DBFB8C5|nr:toll/interleukin-1 receptor domain-containing protein [Staphylococcus gallinarum]MEB7040063.1 toll/interleukin-1 receptor domain-containing protein [Staphylococcus gallinarum]
MTNNQKSKQVFISYAHTDDKHKNRVKFIATELRMNYGLNVILDVWSFKKGQDLNKAMEEYGTKSDIILIIGDKNYVDKANERYGGVGKESILFSDTYPQNSNNNKYNILYAFTEIDENNRPIIPKYMLGINSFDLTDESKDLEKIEEIAREIYEEPKDVAPPIGVKPDFSKSNYLQSIRKMKLVSNIDNTLFKGIVEEIKVELSAIDKEYKKYQDVSVRPDFSGIVVLLNYWDSILKKVNKPSDIAKILEELLNTLDDRIMGNDDATRIFIRLSFIYTIKYAIENENFSLIDDLIKYDYVIDRIECNFEEICFKGNPYFIQVEQYQRGIDYKTSYFQIEEQIFRDTEFSIVDALEADVFIEFVSLCIDQKNLGSRNINKWKILDSNIYTQVLKYKTSFKFLKSFKREKIVKKLFTILNIDDLTEFKQLIEDIDNAKLFLVIEKEKIASQK